MLWRSYHAMEELSCYGGAIMLWRSYHAMEELSFQFLHRYAQLIV